ncbi:MAG: biotin--[acetyl-CoA-carboxylase] ligase [Candidatus Riflemargulisbacteria bacterium]
MIYRFSEIDSTNDYALRSKETLVSGDVVIASRQTKGHGRFNREWVSDSEDNVYLTVVLGDISNFSVIPLYTAVVLVRVLESFGVNTKIKWPNDIFVDSKKIAGILVQSSLQGNNQFVVVGVGLNIRLSEEEKEKIGVPVVSLQEIGVNIVKDSFIEVFLDKFFIDLEKFTNQGFSFIKEEYEFNSSLTGKQINVKCSNKEFKGKVIGFSNTGEILIEENNQVIAMNSVEVLKVL